MRILIVHQYYLASGQPGGSRFNELAKYWANAGHEVSVIAGSLNYLTGDIPRKYRKRWVTQERDDQVNVWRCFVPSSYGKSYVGRMAAFLGFLFSSVTAALRVPLPDVIIATSPPLITVLAAWAITFFRGRNVPWIFEIRDLWPESAITTGVIRRNSLLARLLSRLESWSCRAANRVNVLTPAFRDDLLRRNLAPSEKIDLVPNGADTGKFFPMGTGASIRERMGWGTPFVLLYAGAHGLANAVGQLVFAAEELKNRKDILIACVGDGPERRRWEAEARTRGLRNIVFHGPQPKERMPELVNACDAGAAILQDNPTFATVYPNKVFDYMACGRPTLLAIDGVARKLICVEAKAGVFAKPEDPKSLADAIRWLADHPAERSEMGKRGRDWVVTHASRDSLARRYLGILECLNEDRSRSEAIRAQNRLAWAVKDFLDRAAAAVAMLLLSPLFLILMLANWISMGHPIFFCQDRPGLRGKAFRLIKFRTMREGEGEDEARLTRLGRFLRASSLDELPELWNVLTGTMSFVGPRPLLMRYLDRYSPEQARRHLVKPGITGWAQINGRNSVEWGERFRLDVWYVDHWSLGLDLKILVKTVWQVLARTGINAKGSATMPEFKGPDARG